MSNLYLICSICLFQFVHIQAQDIIDVTYVRTFTTLQANFIKVALGLTVPVEHNVDLYKVEYTTTGSDMRLDTASGLFMIPVDYTQSMPIACYQHGTTDGRDVVPSNFNSFFEIGAVLASNGMAVVAPDFLGMGSSRGFHPYVHAETEATAAVDMIRALQTYMAENELAWNKQLFITGYSQGGHAAMALHKYIEEEIPGEFQVTASLPMSGPYSLSGVMIDLAFGNEEFNFPSYLVYSSRGLKEIHPDLYNDESELFKEEFLDDIYRFTTTGNGTTELNLDLVEALLINYGAVLPGLIFKDSVLQVLQSQPEHPFNLALKESDLYDWTPQAPVYMLYCEGDDQVPFRNTIIADSTMNARGAIDVSSKEVSGGRDLDHGQCAIPALNEGIPWLLSFMQTTPTTDIIKIAGLRLAPNPADQNFTIQSEQTIEKLLITDLSGRTYEIGNGANSNFNIDTHDWASGMYLMYLSTEVGVEVRKVIIQH
ncbi:MAG: pimeloyl-ACP methyl ester carboxylesterase [Saprospiraceae bacterium]|jgi:pimeloyl-ACP methyl ester carboxylesterase